jgi:hypothetical protein
LALLASCANSAPSAPPEATQALGDLRYAPPSGWSHHDSKEISRVVSRWVPEENPNKESISIIRTTLRPALKGAAPAQFEEVLTQAQGSLPSPAVQAPTMTKTKQNLQEVEIVADFIPSGLKQSYHRVHALVVDGDVLVHVLYTARTPDPDLKMFRLVVDSIHRGEG